MSDNKFIDVENFFLSKEYVAIQMEEGKDGEEGKTYAIIRTEDGSRMLSVST